MTASYPKPLKRALALVWRNAIRLFPETRAYRVKRWLLERGGVNIGDGVRVVSSARMISGPIEIGHGSYVGHEVLVVGNPTGPVRVGQDVDIAPRCVLVSGTHEIGSMKHRAGPGRAAGITVGDGTWLGAGSLVLSGVTIGAGVVVAAGAVVSGNVPDNVLVAGVPARVMRKLLNEADRGSVHSGASSVGDKLASRARHDV